MTVEDYERAARFLSWNQDRYVTNANIQPYWVGGADRFWYARTSGPGEKEFVLVDAETGRQSPAFDHESIAAAMSAAMGREVSPDRLPFTTFQFVSQQRAIEFEIADHAYTCDLDAATCVRKGPAVAEHELPSPNGKFVAFRRNHNLWIRVASDGREFPLTTDGVEHYGYAESPGYSTHYVSDLRSARRTRPHAIWSPDSRHLLSFRLDERRVDELSLLQSVPEDGSMRPKLYTYRYALPGDEHLPLAEPLVFDVVGRRKIALAMKPLICLPRTPVEKRTMWWADGGRSIYFVSPERFSRSVGLYRADTGSAAVRKVIEERSDTFVQMNAGDLFGPPLVRTLRNGDVIWYSQRDGWGHLYRYGPEGQSHNRITAGDWNVREIVRVDEASSRIFFMASGREEGRDPYQQHLYSIKLDGSSLQLLTPEEAEHRISNGSSKDSPGQQADSFSFSGKYFVDSYSRPDVPPVLVLRRADGSLVRRLEKSDISKLRAGGYTPVEPFEVRAADGKTAIYGNLFRPSGFDSAGKYPVIDSSYPGPQAIRTRKSFVAATFDTFEAQSLAELGFVVVTIDGRGTPYRSREFLDHSYGRMSRASELEDHIAAVRELARRYPYMDLTRVGIDGVSGGGFMAARAILEYPDFYKVAVSAEGNHDMRGYLAPWEETYGGSASVGENVELANPRLARNLKGKLFLMHGELDDNVSPALTMRLVDALIAADKDFDLLIMPNADHRAFLNPYFIRRKWDYFVRNLLGAEPPRNYSIEPPQ